MSKKATFKSQLLAVFSVFAAALLSVSLVMPVFAAGEDLSTPVNKTGQMGEPVAITDLQITGTGNDDVSIAITATSGAFAFGTEDADVTGGGTASVVVSGPPEDVNSTLATLTFTANTPGVVTVTADYGSSVTDVIIDPVGGHAYKIIDAELTWNQARDAAKQLVYGGVQGYLANITSESEDSFIVEHLTTGNGWIGASDQGQENKWIWMDGPEEGLHFWQGNDGGQPVVGEGDEDLYNNWNSSEPNNSSNEDCAEYIVGQGWNDLNCDSEQRNYVVEFGAASETPVQVTREFTITTTAATRNISTCEQLFALTSDSNRYDTINLTGDINCAGVSDLEPLFNDGSFQGIFNGNGHTIRNVAIDEESDWDIALFAQANGATFKNVTLSNFTVNGAGRVAALVGFATGSVVIENVHVSNVSLGVEASRAGGLAGQISVDGISHITGSSVDGGTITCTNDGAGCSYFGGLVGQVEAYDGGSLLVEKSYSNVRITATDEGGVYILGGLIGFANVAQYSVPEGESSSITLRDVYSWSTIDIADSVDVGGLVGSIVGYSVYQQYPVAFSIQRAYAWGDLTGAGGVGGLVGSMSDYNNTEFTLQNVFAMGKVIATDTVGEVYQGAIVAQSQGVEVDDNLVATGIYYDQTRTTQDTAGFVDGLDGVVTAVNSDDSQATYFINNTSNAPLSTWNFEDVWVANEDVPPTFAPYELGEDLNGDEVPDSEQPNVSGYISPITGKIVAIDAGEGCELTTDNLVTESSLAAQDPNYDYANGLFDFAADCGEEGFTTTISLYYYDVDKADAIFRKFNPNTNQYSTINSTSISETTIHGSSVIVVSYQLTDGGELDMDGEENGAFEDPAGLATATSSTASNLASTGQSKALYMWLTGLLVVVGLATFALRRIITSKKSKTQN